MAYPREGVARDRFVLSLRGAREVHDPWRPQGILVEDEPVRGGGTVSVGTIFLTGRECPWRCVMCDLWRQTTTSDTPVGAIPLQIERALAEMRHPAGSLPPHLKLYNAGSYFDPRAVPVADDEAVATQLAGFARVIVESHPALVGDRTWRLRDRLASGRASRHLLEVAMGLETVHPEALDCLHKQVTIEMFAEAAAALAGHDVALRAFVLVAPPFVPADEQDAWLQQSVAFALDCGAAVVSLIPTRAGNGALDALAADGRFAAPHLGDLERGLARALARASARGVVLADLWDLDRFADCAMCIDARRLRLHLMNLTQRNAPPLACAACGGTDA